MTTIAANRTADRPLIGIAMLLSGLLMMTVISALVKKLAVTYSLQQILFFRFAFAALPFWILLPRHGGLDVLKTKRPGQHAVRTICGLISISAYFYAVSTIPLADATALSYAAPIFIVMLSIPFLGEVVGPRRWAAVALGFIGVLVIASPEGAHLAPGYIAAIVSAVTGAMVSVWLRRLAPTERTSTIAIFYNSTGAIVFGVWAVMRGWVVPDAGDLLLLLLLGLLASPQQYLFIASYRFAEASLLAPFDYTIFVFVAAVGYIFWNEVPAATTWAGCAVIAASGLFVAYRERQLAKRRITRPVRVP